MPPVPAWARLRFAHPTLRSLVSSGLSRGPGGRGAKASDLAPPSPRDLIPGSIPQASPSASAPAEWMAGSSPAMTSRGMRARGKKHANRKIILDIGENMFYKRSIPSHPGAWLEPSCHGGGMRLSGRAVTDGMARGAGETKLRGPDTTVRTHDLVLTPAVTGCWRPVMAGRKTPIPALPAGRAGSCYRHQPPAHDAAGKAPPSAPFANLRRAEPALSSPPGTLRAAKAAETGRCAPLLPPCHCRTGSGNP